MDIRKLLVLLSLNDRDTFEHCVRVYKYTKNIIEGLRQNVDKTAIMYAAILHDFGKLYVDKEILLKPSQLNDKERLLMQEHSSLGATALNSMGFPENITQPVLYHHIRYDNEGYPKYKPNMRAPLDWFIIPVADSFDAMTSKRPYKNIVDINQAITEIEKGRGSQFHPIATDAFLQAFEKDPEMFKVS